MLSGHTHRWLAGLHHEEAGSVYGNAGLGASALPWRLGAPARREIALLDVHGG